MGGVGSDIAVEVADIVLVKAARKYETMPQSKSMEPRTVCYARVSSGDQKNDRRLHLSGPVRRHGQLLGMGPYHPGRTVG